MDTRGATRKGTIGGAEVARAREGFVTGLPAEAADAVVVDAVLLVVPCVVTGEAEWFFGCGVAEGEMIEFLEEGESFEAMEGVYKVGFLFIYDGVCGSDVFEMAVGLVGMT